MNVTKTKNVGTGHSIEIGEASWDESQTSIRNRYATSTGGFSPRSSSELPINDVCELVKVISDEDLLDPKILAEMIKSISESLNRQL